MDLWYAIYDHFQFLLAWKHENPENTMEKLLNTTEVQRFLESLQDLRFIIAMNCLGVLNGITDHFNDLPLCAKNSILVEKDCIVILVKILELTPWIRKGMPLERYEKHGWKKIQVSDLQTVSLNEGRVR